MEDVLTYQSFHPFVRCVGSASEINLINPHMAYDYRMIVVPKGAGTVLIDSQSFDVTCGGVFIIPPATPYRVCVKSDLGVIVINFDMTHKNAHISMPVVSVPEGLFEKENVIEKCDVSCFFQDKSFFAGEISQEILKLGKNILYCYKNKTSEADSIYITAIFMQVMYHLISVPSGKKINPMAKEIYTYVCENASEEISLVSVAEKYHLHPTYVNRLLKNGYGTSMKQLMLKCRFEQAVYFLDSTDMTVKEIAESVGFKDASYFSNAFYKYFGYYPTKYRV